MRVPFGEWCPDLAELDAGVAALAENVYPASNSYMPVLGPRPYSSPIEASPRGLFMAQQLAGNFVIIAGTADKLFRFDSSTLDFDEYGSGYTVPADELWSGTQFGTDFIATNVNDAPQVLDLEVGSSFGPLTGSPPAARVVGVVEGHVFLLSTSTDPSGGQWSGIEDATQWTPGSDGSDVFSFADGGRIMNLAPAAKLIVQERAIRRIIHQPGDAIIFAFDKLEDAKGSIAPYSVVALGSAVGYLAEDGFWFNGQPIGKDKVDRFFFSEVDQSRLFSVLGTYDPTRPLIYWAYRTGESDLYNRVLVYNWKTQRWSVISANLYMLSNIATPGVTLEGLDALYPNLDTDVPFSLDSRVWLGGRPVFGVFDESLRLSFFEGDTLEATLDTGEIELVPGKTSWVTSVRPMVDTTEAVARVGSRARLGDARTFGPESAMKASGRCPVRVRDRYHRFRLRIPAGATWTHAQGVDVEGRQAGSR